MWGFSIFNCIKSIAFLGNLGGAFLVHSFCNFPFKLYTPLQTPIHTFIQFKTFHYNPITLYYPFKHFQNHSTHKLISHNFLIFKLHSILYSLYNPFNTFTSIYFIHSNTFKHSITKHFKLYFINHFAISLDKCVTGVTVILSWVHRTINQWKWNEVDWNGCG